MSEKKCDQGFNQGKNFAYHPAVLVWVNDENIYVKSAPLEVRRMLDFMIFYLYILKTPQEQSLRKNPPNL